MSRYLYPYIREILLSRDNLDKNPFAWDSFNKRFIELTKERFNVNSMRVKKLLDPRKNEEKLVKALLTLALSISENGYKKLRNSLLNI